MSDHPPIPARKTALAFLAHPDDAEFICAGTLIRLASKGWEIHIATATAGDCGTMTETPWAIAGRRTAEAAAAAALINAKYHCLGERDGMVIYDRYSVQRTMDLFRRIAPTLLFIHAARDYHVDHEMASLLGRAASFMHATPNMSPFDRLPGTQVPCMYYCDPFAGVDPMGGQLISPTTVVDIREQLELKAKMLICHESQREWLRAHHGMDEYIESMKRHSAMRGQLINSPAAEAFVQHKGHPYPQNDWLKELLG